jgi:hypothetical protein
MLTAYETDGPSAGEIEPSTPCFGVACFAHRHCARYAAVGRCRWSISGESDPWDMLEWEGLPLFVRIPESEGDRAAPFGELPDRMEGGSTTEAMARDAHTRAA